MDLTKWKTIPPKPSTVRQKASREICTIFYEGAGESELEGMLDGMLLARRSVTTEALTTYIRLSG